MSGPAGASDGEIQIDARRLTYRIYGDLAGAPVLALHGTPGSRLKFSATDEFARREGLAVIAPDRWGYGGSDPHPSPSLAAFAADMAALLDRLGHRRAALMGISGGGPYVAAVAALLGARVSALALVSPVGPIVPDGAAGSMASLTPFHVFCFRGLPRMPRTTGSIFAGLRWLLNRNRDLAMSVAFLRTARRDQATIRNPDIRKRLADTFVDGLRQGVKGPVTDLHVFGRPWGVPLDAIVAPSALWIGTSDMNVPQDAARRLAAAVPGCELRVLDGEGHLWIAEHYADVLAWLKQAGESGAGLRN